MTRRQEIYKAALSDSLVPYQLESEDSWRVIGSKDLILELQEFLRLKTVNSISKDIVWVNQSTLSELEIFDCDITRLTPLVDEFSTEVAVRISNATSGIPLEANPY